MSSTRTPGRCVSLTASRGFAGAELRRSGSTLKDHHELALTGEAAKPADFDAKEAANQDPLYSWSKLRADYLGQANLNMAETYAGNPGFYPGWMLGSMGVRIHLAAG